MFQRSLSHIEEGMGQRGGHSAPGRRRNMCQGLASRKRLERQKVFCGACHGPCECLCGCERGVCTGRGLLEVDRDRVVQDPLPPLETDPFPGWVGRESHSQGQPTWRTVWLAGLGWASSPRDKAGLGDRLPSWAKAEGDRSGTGGRGRRERKYLL